MAIARFLQGRTDEAFALAWESTYQHPSRHLVMAAICGHLGRLREAREALALYRAATPAPIEDAVVKLFARPEHRRLILEGIGLATGETAAGA